MRILPVLDLMGGHVVRGVAGRRSEYRPLVSRLCASSDPVAVALALRDHLGLAELYVADLDAIQCATPAWSIYAALQAAGFRLWLDAGIRTVEDAVAISRAGILHIVAGLETLADRETLGRLCNQLGSDQVVFSLDLRDGQPIASSAAWRNADAFAIAQTAVAYGVRRMIVLDLVRVGLAEGLGTEALCQRLIATFPDLKVLTGGGVRDVGDLHRLHQAGVAGVLVASALHDGRLTCEDLRQVTDS
jgi:phosphoribosylformimino-5-aminoimidazole carboxamide ribotide isomerase